LEGLSGSQFRLWHSFLAAYAAVVPTVEARLADVIGLSLGEFEVLRQLEESGGRMRMAELADRVNASRSGLTRRIDRLEQQHLVVRQSVPDDKRGAYAVLTSAGRETVAEAMPAYQETIGAYLLASVAGADHTTLLEVFERIAEGAHYQRVFRDR
jgi:DNA-binding MarR family transcriptional regulator